ncbi:hypothetical protein HY490_01780 [Candidatus Woesearchaeota archaeon]|nr:hypothetical protein [Candidatus Woesearchaeota archaeon]
MTEAVAQVLERLEQELKHIRSDVEEIKDIVYPPESKIRPAFIKDVDRVEQEIGAGKRKRFLSPDEAKRFLTSL